LLARTDVPRDLTGAVALFGEVVDETTTAHTALLQVLALVGQSYAMAMQVTCSARTTVDEALTTGSEDSSTRRSMQRGGRCRLPGRRRCRRGVEARQARGSSLSR
jgi:hypothetical protein